MAGEPLEARSAAGERVVVRLDDGVLDVFHETGSHRFHAALVDAIAVEPSPAPAGEKLVVRAARHGIEIPARFDGADRERLERIVASVAAAR